MFDVESVHRSAFYDDTIHYLSSEQWMQPAVISWPDLSVFATKVTCQRLPSGQGSTERRMNSAYQVLAGQGQRDGN